MASNFLNGAKGRASYVKSSKIKLPRATYHILFLGVCLVVSGVIMAIFGYYAPLLKMPHSSKLGSSMEGSQYLSGSNDSAPQLNPDIQSGARKSPKSHFLSLKDKYAAAVESNADRSKGKSTWLDWYDLRLTVFSYAGPCFMGLGCIILVVVYVVAFEARDRARHSSVIVLKDASIQSSQRLMARPDPFWRETYRPLSNRNGSRHARSPRLSANLSDPELYVRFERDANAGLDIFDANSNLVPTIVIGDSFSGVMSDIPSCSHDSSPRDPRYGVISTRDDYGDEIELLSAATNPPLAVSPETWGETTPTIK